MRDLEDKIMYAFVETLGKYRKQNDHTQFAVHQITPTEWYLRDDKLNRHYMFYADEARSRISYRELTSNPTSSYDKKFHKDFKN